MGFLAGKRILITGVLSKHSIAYGIARACHREGAQLAFTYQNERFLERITKFAAEFDSTLVFPCDVSDDAQIDQVFADLGLAPMDPEEDRAMVCGSLAFNHDVKAVLETFGLREGANSEPLEYVVEKAFVGDGI